MDVITVATQSLGDRSYLVVHDHVAVAVDPQRDIDRFTALLDEREATLSHVLETHVHNDYVTGGHALARHTGAAYVLNKADDTTFDHVGVSDGDVFTAGTMTIRVMATPGHTFTHLAYVIEVPGRPAAVFSGGSLLYGATGRPDLLGPDHTDELVARQWDSARRLVAELPGDAMLLPTHGFGSFCAATQVEAPSGTLADEQAANPVLTADRDTFVAETLANLGDWPSYYVHMAPANLAGPAAPDLSPPEPADAMEIARRIHAGEWVVDLRSRTTFAPAHVAGTINIGADGNFVTQLGWLLPWGTPVTLLGTADQVAEAQRDMVRIGIDRPAGAGVGDRPERWTTTDLHDYPVVDFAALAARRDADDMPTVLDVRRDGEHATAAIPGALHVPLHELPGRIHEVVGDVPVWVHCAGGYRASVAASLLARSGRSVVLVDDSFDRARELGLAAT